MAAEQSSPDLLVLSSLDTKAELSVNEKEQLLDLLDKFNKPRFRRILILQQLLSASKTASVSFECVRSDPLGVAKNRDLLQDTYGGVVSARLIEFLSSAWVRWDELGKQGQDPSGCLEPAATLLPPPLIPSNAPLLRANHSQRPSRHVLGAMGYFCTDHCTPIFDELLTELRHDATLVQSAVEKLRRGIKTIFLLPTHPGHHAAYDSFGGYCYLNHAAAVARLWQRQSATTKKKGVAILDIDYHCGNGTASIFDEDPCVLTVSLHCDPDWEYPFHNGFADEVGKAQTTLHLPLPPATAWPDAYEPALQKGLQVIRDFFVDYSEALLVVSMGLDTYDQDPCSIRRAGFCLNGDDYKSMGRVIGEGVPTSVDIVFVQEGGYRMDVVGRAAADVVVSCSQTRSGSS